VDDDADRGFNSQGHAIDQGVGDADGLDGEWAEGELFSGCYLDEGGFVEEFMLFEFAFNVSEGKLGGVDGDFELGENPGQAADVVLVSVGEDDGANMLFVFNEVADIGDYDIHAQQFRLGEHQPGVDHDNVVFPANGHAVHAEFAESTKGDNFQFFRLHLSCTMLTPVGRRGLTEVTGRGYGTVGSMLN